MINKSTKKVDYELDMDSYRYDFKIIKNINN